MTFAQNDAISKLMTDGYSSLQAAGVITTPASQAISAVRGVVFTGGASPLTAVTSAVTNSVNSQVGSLVANASKFGTPLTAQSGACKVSRRSVGQLRSGQAVPK